MCRQGCVVLGGFAGHEVKSGTPWLPRQAGAPSHCCVREVLYSHASRAGRVCCRFCGACLVTRAIAAFQKMVPGPLRSSSTLAAGDVACGDIACGYVGDIACGYGSEKYASSTGLPFLCRRTGEEMRGRIGLAGQRQAHSTSTASIAALTPWPASWDNFAKKQLH